MATGERLYQQRLGGAASGFSSSPVTAGGRLYITNEEGHSYVLALGPEYKLLAAERTRRNGDGHDRLFPATLFTSGEDRHLFAIGAKPVNYRP